MRFGRREGWVDRSQVVGVAVDRLLSQSDADDPDLATLAGASDEDDEEIDALLDRLAERSAPVSDDEIRRRWWLAHLECLVRRDLEPEALIETAEQLWAELGYPPELEQLSPYYAGSTPHSDLPDPAKAPLDLAASLRSELTSADP